MNELDRLANAWLDWLVASGWQMTLLVCVVALFARALHRASPRLRYALWLLVLIKVFLPPSLTAPWSVGTWAVAPLVAKTELPRLLTSATVSAQVDESPSGAEAVVADSLRAVQSGAPNWIILFMLTWAASCLMFWTFVVVRYARLAHRLRSSGAIDEGPQRIALEQLALSMRIRRVPELLATRLATSPFLVGVFRPRIVLPEELLENWSTTELRAVLTHELIHWQRRDTWIGWLQVLAQGLFWHHPFVWWANRQIRHERECVCDEAVLRLGTIEPPQYGESLLRVLTAARGRSLAGGSLAGVFEPSTRLQDRLENIMNYEPSRRRFGLIPRVALVALAILIVPMAPTSVEPRLRARAAEADTEATEGPSETPYPQVVKTVPEVGATDVDTKLGEIAVTFDRDMQRGGMSWVGSMEYIPIPDESRKPHWVDDRTCVLPVHLRRGRYYCLYMNSTNHDNFKSKDGIAAPPRALYFVTAGASEGIKSRIRVPRIVSIEPVNGATDVDPATREIRVTFDVPMGKGGSWVGRDGPNTPKGAKPTWSEDGLTCTLSVLLEPGRDYRLGFNGPFHFNFQSQWGVPLEPVVYEFSTTATK